MQQMYIQHSYCCGKIDVNSNTRYDFYEDAIQRMKKNNDFPECENCENMKCVDDSYKSYYCMRENGYICLGVDRPPKKPPKSCPKLSEQFEKGKQT